MFRFLLLITVPVLLFGKPSWFYNLTPSHSNEIIGYGTDKSLDNAKKLAISDIVKTISVKIESTTEISKEIRSGSYNRDLATNLKTESKATLSGVEVEKAEKIDGVWYVAAKYDNSPVEIKLSKQLKKVSVSDETQNPYLATTPLFVSLNREVGKKLNFKVLRKDNLWQIGYKDAIEPLNQSDFYRLFSNHSSDVLSIKANKKTFFPHDDLFFTVEHKNAGFITLLYSEHNGKTGVLLSNKKSAGNFTYPDQKSEEALRIVNPYKMPIKELYIAIYSESPINLEEFENVGENLLDESNYNFHRLIEKLSDHTFSSTVIKIKK